MTKQRYYCLWICIVLVMNCMIPISNLCASSVKNLHGIIIDENTGKPLANTEIVIQNSASVEESILVYTNASGVFEVEVSAGIYKMHVTNHSYYTAEIFKSIPFDEQTEVQMTISLNRIVVGQIVALKGILFSLNNTRFRVHSRDLEDVLHLLRTNPLIIEISCHTDSRGDDAYNMKLSQQRAESIVQSLIMKGISESQLVARGYGETFPLNHCTNGVRCSGREHTQNRRVEYAIVGFVDNKLE